MNEPQNGPFAGVRVLDLGAMIAGPFAAAILADQGAEVIKVEAPGIGDVMRYLGATRNGLSALYHNSNRGKRSLALDLKQEKAQAIVHQLVRETDVVLQNFRPGVAGKLNVDYETLKQHNPELIYLSVSGFGSSGPMAHRPAYDNVIQAFSGITQSQANIDSGEPTPYYQLFTDKLTALTGAQAISAALFARGRGRGGQHIELAMVDAVTHFQWLDSSGTASFHGDGAQGGMNISKARLLPFSDGYATIAPVTDSQFQGLCRALGLEDVAPELDTVMGRNSHPELMQEFFVEIFHISSQIPVEQGLAKMEAEDVPCAKAMHLADLPEHPQMQANNSFVHTEHPLGGTLVEPNSPPKFSVTPSGVGGPSAALGQHTHEILEKLGLDELEIAGLREAGVVA